MSKNRADNNGKHSIPDKKSDDRHFSNMAFFPGNLGMSDVGDDDSDGSSNKAREPEEIIVFDDKISQYSIKDIIKNCDTDANKEIPSSMSAGFNVGIN